MRRSVLSVLAIFALAPSTGAAQQPLREFLQAASTQSLDVREARAALDTARSQVDEARARLLPSIVGVGSYTRNEPVVEVSIPTGMVDAMGMPITRQASITPANQLTGSASATIPLIDLTAWAGFFQSEAFAEVADAQFALTRQNVDIVVVQLWHLLVGQRYVARAAERSLETATRNQQASEARVQVGVSPQLELARAQAEVARARQALVEAQLGATLSARNLENVTGVRPTARVVTLEEALGADPPLAHFVRSVDDLPAVRAARQAERAAGIARDAAWLALLPIVSGTAVARISNAAGFGRQDSYYAGLTATWVLDFARPARIGTASAQLEGAHVRSERALQVTETAIFEACSACRHRAPRSKRRRRCWTRAVVLRATRRPASRAVRERSSIRFRPSAISSKRRSPTRRRPRASSSRALSCGSGAVCRLQTEVLGPSAAIRCFRRSLRRSTRASGRAQSARNRRRGAFPRARRRLASSA